MGMDRTEEEKQREIGKQLFLVSILQHEEDRIQKGGWPFLSKEHLAEWASMTEEELERFIDVNTSLNLIDMSTEAANRCSEAVYPDYSKDAYCFILSTYYRMGHIFVLDLDIGNIDEFCEATSEINYRTYCERHEDYPVDESFATPKVFKILVRFFIIFLTKAVKKALAEGYDWDVVSRMTRVDLTEDRFYILASGVDSWKLSNVCE